MLNIVVAILFITWFAATAKRMQRSPFVRAVRGLIIYVVVSLPFYNAAISEWIVIGLGLERLDPTVALVVYFLIKTTAILIVGLIAQCCGPRSLVKSQASDSRPAPTVGWKPRHWAVALCLALAVGGALGFLVSWVKDADLHQTIKLTAVFAGPCAIGIVVRRPLIALVLGTAFLEGLFGSMLLISCLFYPANFQWSLIGGVLLFGLIISVPTASGMAAIAYAVEAHIKYLRWLGLPDTAPSAPVAGADVSRESKDVQSVEATDEGAGPDMGLAVTIDDAGVAASTANQRSTEGAEKTTDIENPLRHDSPYQGPKTAWHHCRACDTKVIPMSDGRCPNCKRALAGDPWEQTDVHGRN